MNTALVSGLLAYGGVIFRRHETFNVVTHILLWMRGSCDSVEKHLHIFVGKDNG